MVVVCMTRQRFQRHSPPKHTTHHSIIIVCIIYSYRHTHKKNQNSGGARDQYKQTILVYYVNKSKTSMWGKTISMGKRVSSSSLSLLCLSSMRVYYM